MAVCADGGAGGVAAAVSVGGAMGVVVTGAGGGAAAVDDVVDAVDAAGGGVAPAAKASSALRWAIRRSNTSYSKAHSVAVKRASNSVGGISSGKCRLGRIKAMASSQALSVPWPKHT